VGRREVVGGGAEKVKGLGEGCPVRFFPGKAGYSASFEYNGQILMSIKVKGLFH
jgi:hypothetical protein